MSSHMKSGVVGSTKYFLNQVDDIVEAEVTTVKTRETTTLPTWEMAERWVDKTIVGLAKNEIERDL